jgi:hypothetical protein
MLWGACCVLPIAEARLLLLLAEARLLLLLPPCGGAATLCCAMVELLRCTLLW